MPDREKNKPQTLLATYGKDAWYAVQSSIIKCRARLSNLLETLQRMFIEASSNMRTKSRIGYTQKMISERGFDNYRRSVNEDVGRSDKSLDSSRSASYSFYEYVWDKKEWQAKNGLSYNWYCDSSTIDTVDDSDPIKASVSQDPGVDISDDKDKPVKLFNYSDAVKAVELGSKYLSYGLLHSITQSAKFTGDTEHHHTVLNYGDINKVLGRISLFEEVRTQSLVSGAGFIGDSVAAYAYLFLKARKLHSDEFANTMDMAAAINKHIGLNEQFINPIYYKTLDKNKSINETEENFGDSLLSVGKETDYVIKKSEDEAIRTDAELHLNKVFAKNKHNS